jgi:hypothetical protein
MKAVIVCIAKLEHDYIEEFVKYHLALGFETIYIYDNEDEPTYEKQLEKYASSVIVFHLPGNHYGAPVQYVALYDFVYSIMPDNDNITHVAHLDIDEFIVLKKHRHINDFINEYIVGDCGAIGINWRHFGSSGNENKINEPNTIRFTKCEEKGNKHIKTLFCKKYFLDFYSCHAVNLTPGYFTKSTNGTIINGALNEDIDFSIIQLNHYKCKTLEEFKYIRTRGRADIKGSIYGEDVVASFNMYNINEIEDLTARNFYSKLDV